MIHLGVCNDVCVQQTHVSHFCHLANKSLLMAYLETIKNRNQINVRGDVKQSKYLKLAKSNLNFDDDKFTLFCTLRLLQGN